MFIIMSEKVYNESLENKLKMNLTLIQNQTIKNQVTSIWKYYNDKHLQEVRLYLSKHSAMLNSLFTKEVVYSGEVKIDSSN
jgi:hypothetical protein